jgi:hypothetical protein
MESSDNKRKLSAVERHHRQAAWQIWVPVGLAIAVVLTLFVLSILATVYNVPISKTLGPVAAIWVIIPNCISGIIPLAILAGLVFLTAKLLGGLPKLGSRILNGFDRLHGLVQRLSDRLASPVLKVHGWKAGWDKFWEDIWPSKSHRQGG